MLDGDLDRGGSVIAIHADGKQDLALVAAKGAGFQRDAPVAVQQRKHVEIALRVLDDLLHPSLGDPDCIREVPGKRPDLLLELCRQRAGQVIVRGAHRSELVVEGRREGTRTLRFFGGVAGGLGCSSARHPVAHQRKLLHPGHVREAPGQSAGLLASRDGEVDGFAV